MCNGWLTSVFSVLTIRSEAQTQTSKYDLDNVTDSFV